MTMINNDRSEKLQKEFKIREEQKSNLLEAIEKPLSLDERLALLSSMDREDLVSSFKKWRPRSRKKQGIPLDQRVSITVTSDERFSLDSEIRTLKKENSKFSMSEFIRNRTLGSIDISGWREIAAKTLVEIEDIASNAADLRKRKTNFIVMADSEQDQEQIYFYNTEIVKIQNKLNKITAQNEKRTHRLSGRMSMPEAETIKWRASRLQLSASDYLRMLIFNLEPNTSADAHLSLDAKRRFYFGVLDVADNGWGEVPKIYNCSQCENYMDEIRRLKAIIDQNETFANASA